MSRIHPVRSSKLVSQYGVGAMVVGRGGTSLIIAGIDSWLPPAFAGAGEIAGDQLYDESEFIIR